MSSRDSLQPMLSHDQDSSSMPSHYSTQPMPSQDSLQPMQFQDSSQPMPFQDSSLMPSDDSSQPMLSQDSSQPMLSHDQDSSPMPSQDSTQPMPSQDSLQPMQFQDSSQPMPFQDSSLMPSDDSSQPMLSQDSSQPMLSHDQDSSPMPSQDSLQPMPSHDSSAPTAEYPMHMYHDPSSFRTLRDFEFDKTGLKCHLSDHGITVIIPENAINEDEALLRVGVYYVDSFQFPEDHRLMSEVFWIDSNVPLQKNVNFYMPHFVKIKNKKDARKLKFFLASDKSFRNYGVFKFTDAAPNHQYSFEPDGCYGNLIFNHFCSGCILAEIDNNDLLPLEYLVTSVFPSDRNKHSWFADFVFSYAVPNCREVCVKHKFGIFRIIGFCGNFFTCR